MNEWMKNLKERVNQKFNDAYYVLIKKKSKIDFTQKKLISSLLY